MIEKATVVVPLMLAGCLAGCSMMVEGKIITHLQADPSVVMASMAPRASPGEADATAGALDRILERLDALEGGSEIP